MSESTGVAKRNGLTSIPPTLEAKRAPLPTPMTLKMKATNNRKKIEFFVLKRNLSAINKPAIVPIGKAKNLTQITNLSLLIGSRMPYSNSKRRNVTVQKTVNARNSQMSINLINILIVVRIIISLKYTVHRKQIPHNEGRLCVNISPIIIKKYAAYMITKNFKYILVSWLTGTFIILSYRTIIIYKVIKKPPLRTNTKIFSAMIAIRPLF